MYKGYTILCVIPARGGSKGLPGKNIMELAGKPLIAYTIEQAKKSKYLDRVIVSTDSTEIAHIALKYGAEIPFMRPKKLANDNSSTIEVLLHAIKFMEEKGHFDFEILVLLHATTPLRSVADIDNSIELLFKTKADNVFSVTPSHRNPYFNMVEKKGGRVTLVKKGNFVSRQSAPLIYDMNSSVYVWWKDRLKKKQRIFLSKTEIYIMPKYRSVDIDDAFDFQIAKMLLKEKYA